MRRKTQPSATLASNSSLEHPALGCPSLYNTSQPFFKKKKGERKNTSLSSRYDKKAIELNWKRIVLDILCLRSSNIIPCKLFKMVEGNCRKANCCQLVMSARIQVSPMTEVSLTLMTTRETLGELAAASPPPWKMGNLYSKSTHCIGINQLSCLSCYVFYSIKPIVL